MHQTPILKNMYANIFMRGITIIKLFPHPFVQSLTTSLTMYFSMFVYLRAGIISPHLQVFCPCFCNISCCRYVEIEVEYACLDNKREWSIRTKNSGGKNINRTGKDYLWVMPHAHATDVGYMRLLWELHQPRIRSNLSSGRSATRLPKRLSCLYN